MKEMRKRNSLGMLIAFGFPMLAFAVGAGEATGILGFFAHPLISTLLLIIGSVALVMEVLTPGFGPFGLVSLLAFGLFFASSLGHNDPSIIPLVLFILGIIFGFIEMMVPGFGLPGIAGIILVTAGIAMSYNNLMVGLQAVSVAIVVTAIAIYVLVRMGARSPVIDKIRHHLNFTEKSGYTTSAQHVDLVGKKGIAISNLRPSGIAEFDGIRYDVVTEGGFIDRGDEVTVLSAHGARILVGRN